MGAVGDLALVLDQAGRIVAEVIGLAGIGAKVGHLPENPFVDGDALALVLAVELAGLAAQVLQDGAGLEDADRLAARSVVVDDGRHAVVGADGQELWRELFADADVHPLQLIGQAHLLERDADLSPVGRGPEVELDGLGHGVLRGVFRYAGLGRLRQGRWLRWARLSFI